MADADDSPWAGGAASTAPAPSDAVRIAHAAGKRARALLFGAAVLFGLSAVLVRLATLHGMNGAQVTVVRFALGLVFVVGVFAARPGTWRPRRKGLLVTRGLFGGFAALLFFLAIERLPAGEATLLNNTFPIWGVLLSFFLLDERPTLHLAAGLALASVGVFLVMGGGVAGFHLGWGELIGIASAITGGIAVTAIRALRATDNAPTIFFAFSVGALAVSIPFALAAWPGDLVAWTAAAGVGVAAFGGQIFMTEAYGALSVAEAALWQQLTPIASYLWALTIGETIGWKTVGGVLLGVAGIVYGSVLGHEPRHRASPEAKIAEGIPAEEP
ncbi:MAG TPA: DMT family transporter [Anaeromyxobacter sp.]|nr:DMT family transporter [Anaeromyxobacter sp.]